MKIIEVDEELYQYIASKTQSIGESASDILRRLLNLSPLTETELPKNNHLEPDYPIQMELQEQLASTTESPVNQKKTNSNQTVEALTQLLATSEFQQESKGVVRFLSILSVLYRTNKKSFAKACQTLQGRTRVYFAQDENTLLQAGRHTKPQQIPASPYWVITNNNSGRKMLILEGAMQAMQLPQTLIEQVRPYFINQQ